MEELVRNYAEGQVSRRVFIRRLIGAGVTLAGATTIANLIQADPAAANGCIDNVHMLADYALSPATLTLPPLGGGVCWIWDPGAPGHSVTDTTGLGLYDSSPNPGQFGLPGTYDWVTSYSHEFTAAGTWDYNCKDLNHSSTVTSGVVKVPIQLSESSVRVGDRVRVSWAQADLGAGTLVFDVEMREPGEGWKPWKSGVTNRSSAFKARVPGRHRLRSRVRDTATGQYCGWSPVASFTAK